MSGYGDAAAPLEDPVASPACRAAGSDDTGIPTPLPPHKWPDHYKPISRVQFESIDELITVLKPLAQRGEPCIIEGTNVIDAKKWAGEGFLNNLMSGKKLLVKKSPGKKFRYFDVKKNTGEFEFNAPIKELNLTYEEFLEESKDLMASDSPSRMYLQETLSGHDEMANEFVSWRWEFLIRISIACGWGLPDSNELFIGMQEAETPLHFDERENLFFQVRGQKEIVVFPFTDYKRLYPFPTTHPCDRQSMVGDPTNYSREAFPNFHDSVGHYAVLKAGDLLYLPYGWWHWLRNLEHLAVSVSFWSLTPPSDLSNGIPDVFSEHMLTRVRRNLEGMLAQAQGPKQHNETMLKLRDAVLAKNEKEPVLIQVRQLLTTVKVDLDKQDSFLLEGIEGRFGIDWQKYV